MGGIMKKIILLYIFIFTFIFPQENIDGYKEFTKAKQFYLNGDNEHAKIEFKNFLEVYKSSKLVRSHYPDYYIAMNYYELGELKKALKFLDSSIYIPKYMALTGDKRSSYFEFERNFYLGEIYARLGDIKKSHLHYKSLIKDYYLPNLEKYEKKALNILSSTDPYYGYILDIKYNHNYENIDKLKEEDIRMVARFLYSKGLFLEFYRAYKNSNYSTTDNKEISIGLLKILEAANQYDFMIELINNRLKSANKDIDYYYYLGNALKKLNKPKEAIEKYKLVTSGPYLDDSIYSIARLYFNLGDYENSILWSKKLKGDKTHELLTRSYFNSGDLEAFKASAIEYIKHYPNSDLAGYYRNMLYNESKNPNYLNWIIKHNLNSYYYQVAYNITKTTRTLEEYPINYKKRVYKETIDFLDEVATLNDPQLLFITSDILNFPKDPVFETFMKIYYLEKMNKYNFAMRLTLKNKKELEKYSNFYPYIYPQYYKDIVKKYSKKYDVEEPLIYGIIRKSSTFNPNLISDSTYFGLMQITLKTAKLYYPNITVEKLLDPEVNIDIGVQHLESLSSKFDSNISLTIAGFHAGENTITNWKLDKNGDIDVEQIPYLESQDFIKGVITNYYKYKNIYKI
jgi:soluble lytic murein transglycosylase